MARTILEDVASFIAQQNAWAVEIPYDISTLYKINDDNLLFVGEQLQKLKDDIQVEITTLINGSDQIQKQLNDFITLYNKQTTSIKNFISSHKGEYLIELKKLYTRIDKEHLFVVKELTGAATDRVDIRQELGYEITKRRSQDNVLNTKIESEIFDRISKQDALKADLEASIAATNVNVTSLDAKISSETVSRTNSITTLTTALANEATARNASDTTLNNAITTVSNNLSIEAATRVAQDNALAVNITATRNTLSNTISEIETRRISDLGILSSRDNLEEDESKKRDYLLLQEIRNIYANAVFTDLQTSNGSAPLDPFNNGVHDWDQIDSSGNANNLTSTSTSGGKDLHGILANLIRKVGLMAGHLQGDGTPLYDGDTWPTNNSSIGLDYWQGSEYRTNAGTLSHNVGAANKNVLESDNTANELGIASSFNKVNILNGELTIDKAANSIVIQSGTIDATTVTDFSINTGTGTMSAKWFAGTATSAQYADVAERYRADKIYPAGTVLSIGGEYEVTLYDPNLPLAGVVSTDPAFKMNDKYNTKEEKDLIDSAGSGSYEEYDAYNPFIALKGRIPVKISNVAKKGYYILADTDNCGKGIAVPKSELCSSDYSLKFIGIALSDSVDGNVEVKV